MWQGLPRPCLFRIVKTYDTWSDNPDGARRHELKRLSS